MSAALRVVYLLALVVWIGEIVFFSFVAAPAIFGVLGAARAGDVVAVIFPRYYAIGGVASGIALVAAWTLRRGAGRRGLWTAAVVALTLGFVVTAWSGVVVYPRARAMRVAAGAYRPGPDFEYEHRQAVVLNGIALVAGLVGLGASATALRP